MEQAYRLPFALRPEIIIDLGANIGLTSVWLAHQYKPTRIIAVEPSPDNARLARLNLSRSNVPSELIEAAVGPHDGTALFQGSGDSNIGRVGTAGAVPVVSMRTILSRHSPGRAVDLMKMDIKGGEQALLTENTEWLDQIRSIVAEFHPDVVDYGGLIKRLESAGFRYLPAGRGRQHGLLRPRRLLTRPTGLLPPAWRPTPTAREARAAARRRRIMSWTACGSRRRSRHPSGKFPATRPRPRCTGANAGSGSRLARSAGRPRAGRCARASFGT